MLIQDSVMPKSGDRAGSNPQLRCDAVEKTTAKRRGRPSSGGREAILKATLELLRERGIGRLTTREVAALAEVSEANVFYHYSDRAGLLKAVFEEGLRPLKALNEAGLIAGPNRVEVMTRMGRALERFLDQALPVITAAQSDSELRDVMGAYMHEQDVGPHRGVRALGDYFAAEQTAGRVRGDVDPHAAAFLFISGCYLRASQRQMPRQKAAAPALPNVVHTIDVMLRPASA